MSENMTMPSVGHNEPPGPHPMTTAEIETWLDAALAPLLLRKAAIMKTLTETATAHPTIEDDETLASVSTNRGLAEAWLKTCEDRRKEKKDPFLQGGRDVDAYFKPLADVVARAIAPLRNAMDAYGQKKLKLERERAEQEAAEAKSREAEAAEVAKAALETGADEDVDQALSKAQRAATTADRAHAKATGNAASLTRTRTDYGGSVGMQELLEFEITNDAAVPREYCIAHEPLIRAALRALAATPEQKAALRKQLDKGKQPIPGVTARIVAKSRVRS
jgi:hypothetical protein